MTARGWLVEVDPPVPEGFHGWLALPSPAADRTEAGARPSADEGIDGGGRDGLPDTGLLEAAAREALARALAPGDRERDGAFDLLAADAFVTWASQAALDEEDADARLRALVGRFSGMPER